MTGLAIEKQTMTDEKMAQSGLKAFFKIAEVWGLNPQQQKTILGIQAPSTFYKYKNLDVKKLPKDTLERISYILGIFKALQILLPDEKSSDAWVKKSNTAPLFGGRSALDRMLSGNVGDLYEVRKYLDAQRGGWA
ncbi:MAG TPA: MbcA/ParS/Xre antitoxin family protein [bacterium]|nr:MbcA/ParS/Xre antitoxin family protein [bacterium]